MTKHRHFSLIYSVGDIRRHDLHEDDVMKRVDGGFELTWHSSPSITTFFPDHRIWEYVEIDTGKRRKRNTVVPPQTQTVIDSNIGGRVIQIQGGGNVTL